MKFEEIPNKKTYKQIVEQIISLVLNGELKNGDKLPGERQLSNMLSTSRASIREAFRVLEIMGILEVRQGGGTYVKSFDISPFLNTIAPLFLHNVDIMGDLMDFRILIEGEALKAAAISGSPNTIASMTAALANMKSEDPQIAEQADFDFHMSIFSATENSVFMLVGECLSYILFTSIHTNREAFSADKETTQIWYQYHEKILDAIKSHAPEQAFTHLRNHLVSVRKYTLANAAN